MEIIALIVAVISAGIVLYVNDRVDKLELRMKRLLSERSDTAAGKEVPFVAPVAPKAAVPLSDANPLAVRTALPPQHHAPDLASGSRLLTGAGIIALLIGAGFFFRFAIENGLISETMRVLIGIAFGGGVMGLGAALLRKYRAYALALVGLGLGLVYLSVYAAYGFYGLMPAAYGAVALAVISLGGVMLALHLDARYLALASLLGGYVGVLLFGNSLSLVVAFSGLFIYGVAAFVLDVRRQWPESALLAVAVSTMALIGYLSDGGVDLRVAMLLVSALYGVFATGTALRRTESDENAVSAQRMTLLLVPSAYVLVSLFALEENVSRAIACVGVAGVYTVLGIIARAMPERSSAAFVPAAALVVPTALALAAALYFEGSALIAVWAAEALVLAAFGSLQDARMQRMLGRVLFVAALFLSVVYAVDSSETLPFLLNEDALTYAFVALSSLVAWVLHARTAGADSEKQKALGTAGAYGLVAYGAVALLVATEAARLTLSSGDQDSLQLAGFAILGVFMTYAATWLRTHEVRYASYGLIIWISLALAFESFDFGARPVLANTVVGALLALLALCWTVYRSLAASGASSDERRGVVALVTVAGNIVSLIVLTQEVSTLFGDDSYVSRVAVSVLWLVYGFGSVAFGVIRSLPLVRRLGMLLLVVAGVKVFVYDALALTDLYRFASFFALGIVFLAAGFLYYRFRSSIGQLVAGEARSE